jgi:hypothetical protein
MKTKIFPEKQKFATNSNKVNKQINKETESDQFKGISFRFYVYFYRGTAQFYVNFQMGQSTGKKHNEPSVFQVTLCDSFEFPDRLVKSQHKLLQVPNQKHLCLLHLWQNSGL